MTLREGAHDFDSKTCLILVWDKPSYMSCPFSLDYLKGGSMRLSTWMWERISSLL